MVEQCITQTNEKWYGVIQCFFTGATVFFRQLTPTLGGSQAAQNMAAEWSEQRPVGLGGKVRQRVSAPVTAPQDTEAFHWDSGRRFLFQFWAKLTTGHLKICSVWTKNIYYSQYRKEMEVVKMSPWNLLDSNDQPYLQICFFVSLTNSIIENI